MIRKQYAIYVYTEKTTRNAKTTREEKFTLWADADMWENIRIYNEAEKAMKAAFRKGGYIAIHFGLWDNEALTFTAFHAETYDREGAEGMNLFQLCDATEGNA